MFMGNATTTDVGSRRTCWTEDADLGAQRAVRLALTRIQDRAKLVAVAQRMAVRLVDARDHLNDVVHRCLQPECGSLSGPGGTKTSNSTDRCCATRRKTAVSRATRCSSRPSLCNPMIEMRWRRRGYGSGTTVDEHHFHARWKFPHSL